VLRLDGDMYGSTMDALNNLYPKLSSGGFCIIDDYPLKGCRQAVDDYRSQHGIDAPFMQIDKSAVYWQKP
jgi:O-methyltransferase